MIGFLAIVFLWGKKEPRQPSQLNVSVPPENEPEQQQDVILLDKAKGMKALSRNESRLAHGAIFIYNGHTWDAYEVLGLKPGASVESIKIAFDKAIKRTEFGSHDFLKSALAVILSQIKEKGYKP